MSSGRSSARPAFNDYGDLALGDDISGHFILVPRAVAIGDQTALETWSNANNVFQFIRIEDIAYDRNDSHVVYMADTGEPRAVPDATTGRLRRAGCWHERTIPERSDLPVRVQRRGSDHRSTACRS